MSYRDHGAEVKNLLTDARVVCGALGWMGGAKRNGATGLLICCPSHGERNASCGITVRGDGTLWAKCHACQWSGDVLSMIALANGLDVQSDFREVLIRGAEIAGDLSLADEIRAGCERINIVPRPIVPAPPRIPEAKYLTQSEIDDAWSRSVECMADDAARKLLTSRAINPSIVDELSLCRVIPTGIDLPDWASIEFDRNGATERAAWNRTGHRLICKVYDCDGVARSIRAWQIDRTGGLKRLPARGKRGTGIVLANASGVGLLSWISSPEIVIVTEGEPDWLTWATRVPDSVAVLGVGSGWWTKDHGSRILPRSNVIIRTHCDKAGDAYATQVIDTLPASCSVWRREPTGESDDNDLAISNSLPANPFDGCCRLR
jgi:hypothetical protein